MKIYRHALAEKTFSSLQFVVIAEAEHTAYRLEVGSARDRRDAVLYRGTVSAIARYATVDGAVTEEMEGRFKSGTCTFEPRRSPPTWSSVEWVPRAADLVDMMVLQAMLDFAENEGLCGASVSRSRAS